MHSLNLMSKNIDLNTEAGQIEAINLQKRKVRQEAKGFGVNVNAPVAGAIRITDTIPAVEPQSTESTPEPAKAEVVATAESIDIAAIVKAATAEAVSSAIAPLNEKIQSVEAKASAVEKEAAATKQQLEKTEAELQATKQKLEATEAEKEVAVKDAKKMEDLGKLMGDTQAVDTKQPLTVLGEGSQEMRNYERLIQQAPKSLVDTESMGSVLHMDSRPVDEYWRKYRNQIRDGVEAVMREAGFLQGAGQRSVEAATLPADIPSVAFQYLSAFVRQNRFEDLIHWQFANTAAAPGVPPRLNTGVPRYPYNTRPTSTAQRELTPGTDITTSTNNVSEKLALITIKELGLGKDSDNPPLGLTSFVRAFSMADLEMIVERNLGMDYQAYKDLCLYSRWFGTDRIVYNNNGAVTTTATDVVSGSQGTITRNFLLALRSYMKTLRIAPFRDGYYGLVLNPTAIAQYFQNLTEQERFVSPEQRDIVSQVLQAMTGEYFGGQVSGYRGTHDGFHIFEQNVYGIGSPGDTGTQTVTFGTGVSAQTCDSNFAFGANTIAWATALPVEIRQDEVTNFNRRNRYIWYSHEAAGDLDVIDDSATGQELRVIQVRNLRTPV